MKHFLFVVFTITCFAACKKNYDAKPTYAGTPIAGTWARQQPFYQPNAQRYDETAASWRRFLAFTFTSDAEPDKIGFANPYVAGKGTNALDFNRLYAAETLSSDSGFYNVTIPKCFQFIPKSIDSVYTGTVVVLAQTVTCYRKDQSAFNILIGPSSQPGTYNTITGLFEIEVQFDESAIGGSSNIKRKYRFTP